MRRTGLLGVGLALMLASGGLAIVAWHDGAIGVATAPTELPRSGEVRFKGSMAPPERAQDLTALVIWRAQEGSPIPQALEAEEHQLLIAGTSKAPLLVFFATSQTSSGDAVASGSVRSTETMELPSGHTIGVVLLDEVVLTEPLVF